MLRLNQTSQGNYSTNNYIVVGRLSRNRIEALSGSISAAIEFRQNSKASSTLSAEQYEVFLANLVDPDVASIYLYASVPRPFFEYWQFFFFVPQFLSES